MHFFPLFFLFPLNIYANMQLAHFGSIRSFSLLATQTVSHPIATGRLSDDAIYGDRYLF